MTAWQDRPPVSRRQVRQNERGDAVDSQVSLAQNPTDQAEFGPFPREGWNTDARATAAPEAPARTDGVVVRGRRAQLQFPSLAPKDQAPKDQTPQTEDEAPQQTPDVPTPEPLSYITQGRPQVPSYDGPSFRGRSNSAAPDQPTDASQGSDAEKPYRERDFSPEGRRSTFTSVPRAQAWTPPAASTDEPSELDYHTQAAPVPASVTPPRVEEHPANNDVPHSERTMTRRELRALQQSNDPLPFDAPSSHTTSADPIRPRERHDASLAPATGQIPRQADALAEFDALTHAEPETVSEKPVPSDESVISEEQVASERSVATDPPQLVEPPKLSSFPLFVAPVAATPPPATEAPAVASVFVASTDPDAAAEVVPAEIVDDEPHNKLPDFDDLLFQSPTAAETPVDAESVDVEPVDVEPTPVPADVEEKPFGLLLQEPGESDAHEAYTPPVGHWSTQASIDDGEQARDGSFSRNVGATSGAITTNALVLPSIPTSDDILSPLSSTGEILVTGSINLPSSMGTTGALPARYDHSDVDALLAADDREDSSDPDSAPVRAIRAISTHTSSGAVITTVKPKGNNRMLTVVAISAAVVAAGIVALLVAGVIFKIF
ncbi:hypothetical protein [Glaciihabitans sp. UYNi722]|uniref:hypothetical protein n=1 Tax=Glaciihabitans sp. UYNi722 TaxID=3156344 RepID=UPI00339A21C1